MKKAPLILTWRFAPAPINHRHDKLLVALILTTLTPMTCLISFLGAWPVLPFMGLEVLALGGALIYLARHAGEYEQLTLSDGILIYEKWENGRMIRTSCLAQWARVGKAPWRGKPGANLFISIHGRQILFGRWINEPQADLWLAQFLAADGASQCGGLTYNSTQRWGK